MKSKTRSTCTVASPWPAPNHGVHPRHLCRLAVSRGTSPRGAAFRFSTRMPSARTCGPPGRVIIRNIQKTGEIVGGQRPTLPHGGKPTASPSAAGGSQRFQGFHLGMECIRKAATQGLPMTRKPPRNAVQHPAGRDPLPGPRPCQERIEQPTRSPPGDPDRSTASGPGPSTGFPSIDGARAPVPRRPGLGAWPWKQRPTLAGSGNREKTAYFPARH